MNNSPSPPIKAADKMVLCPLVLSERTQKRKQGAFSLLLHFKNFPWGKQKELLCIDNTVDLMNRASPSLTPASVPGKEKGRRGKTQSEKYSNVIIEEEPYMPCPLTPTTTTTSHPNTPAWVIEGPWDFWEGGNVHLDWGLIM